MGLRIRPREGGGRHRWRVLHAWACVACSPGGLVQPPPCGHRPGSPEGAVHAAVPRCEGGLLLPRLQRTDAWAPSGCGSSTAVRRDSPLQPGTRALRAQLSCACINGRTLCARVHLPSARARGQCQRAAGRRRRGRARCQAAPRSAGTSTPGVKRTHHTSLSAPLLAQSALTHEEEEKKRVPARLTPAARVPARTEPARQLPTPPCMPLPAAGPLGRQGVMRPLAQEGRGQARLRARGSPLPRRCPRRPPSWPARCEWCRPPTHWHTPCLRRDGRQQPLIARQQVWWRRPRSPGGVRCQVGGPAQGTRSTHPVGATAGRPGHPSALPCSPVGPKRTVCTGPWWPLLHSSSAPVAKSCSRTHMSPPPARWSRGGGGVMIMRRAVGCSGRWQQSTAAA
jgi:hypothetical protein